MNVLMIGGDATSLQEGSASARRLALQRSHVDQLDLFVWPQVHSFAQIRRAAQSGSYDVVTAQDPFWRGLVAYLVKGRARLDIQVHTDLASQSAFRKFLSRWVLRRADSIRVVSERIAREAAAYTGAARITILPVYIDVSRFNGIAHRAHPSFGKAMLWLGRFEPEKDPLAALDITKEVRASIPDAGLTLLGSGSLEGALREKAERMGLAGSVEIVAWQDPAPHVAVADLVVCTSRYEGYGASIVEALACGVAVVAPDVGVAKEAGAEVVPREELGKAAVRLLKSGAKGELRFAPLSQEAWARAWKASLSFER